MRDRIPRGKSQVITLDEIIYVDLGHERIYKYAKKLVNGSGRTSTQHANASYASGKKFVPKGRAKRRKLSLPITAALN